MRIGASLFLLAIGAILTFAVTASVSGVSLSTIESLNPSVNPDSLHPAQRLRLRR